MNGLPGYDKVLHDSADPKDEKSEIEKCEGCGRWVDKDDRKVCENCGHIGCVNCMEWSTDNQAYLCDDSCLKDLEQKIDKKYRSRL